MLPYAAYLRVYEPLTAFAEPERSRWADYAVSTRRPQRASALEAEHDEAIRRLIAVPPIVAPVHESPHAYVRQADGAVYVSPVQTRLRSWLALARLRSSLPATLLDNLLPRHAADEAAGEFARWHPEGTPIRTHILTATWRVPVGWFVPFGPPERWLVLGQPTGSDGGPATAAATRTLVYVTTMTQARRRVARALAAARRGISRGSHPYEDGTPPRQAGGGGSAVARPPAGPRSPGTAPPGAAPRRAGGRHAGAPRREDAARHGGTPHRGTVPRHAGTPAGPDGRRQALDLARTSLPTVTGEIEEVGRWLEGFHPRGLVELDYGGLVHLMDDETLRADQSVAEVAAAVTGLETGEFELAIAMYERLRSRWRVLRDAEAAN